VSRGASEPWKLFRQPYRFSHICVPLPDFGHPPRVETSKPKVFSPEVLMRVLPLSVLASVVMIAAAHAAPTAPATDAPSQPAATSAPAISKTAMKGAPATAARLVWVAAGVYHCPADLWFGRTSEGQLMSEDDARARGYRPNTGHACNAPI
jgi:hypothetical protein